MSLGEFEQVLLFAIVRIGNDAAGADIKSEIEERTGRTVSPGAVYTALDRLEERGYVTSWIGDTAPARGGRRRKHYAITPAGARSLADSYERLQQMAAGLASRLLRLADDQR